MAESIGNKIQQILAKRQNHSRVVTLEELERGLSRVVYLSYDELYLKLPSPGFIRRLANWDDRDAAVATVLQAWSYGVRLRLMVHQQLLRALPLREMAALPIALEDHRRVKVRLMLNDFLTWSDLVPIKDSWLLINKRAVITPMANSLCVKNNIKLIRQE